MKKIISILLTMSIVISCVTVIAAGDTEEIAGFEEKYNALWLKNYFTEEQMNNMVEQWKQSFTDYFMSFSWDRAKTIWKPKNGRTQAEELAHQLEIQCPIPTEGVLVTCTNSQKYCKQYADAGKFEYIFSNTRYWSLPEHEITEYNSEYDMNGNLIHDLRTLSENTDGIYLEDESYAFLHNEDAIKNLLLEKEGTKVDDMKIFSEGHGLTFLYIKCDEDEYLIKIYDSNGHIPKIKLFELYTAKELMIEDEKRGVENQPTYVTPIKPTYDTEAAELQTDGLLNGDGNGLDLLKPLTRIEAAAMLLRAKGESTDNAETTQVFTDVPSTHWGYGVVAKAYSEGIISGMGDNTFAPDNVVSATQFAAMTLRAASDPTEDWTQSLQSLIDRGIVTEEETKTMDLFTRGDMAKIIYEAKNKGLL